ncbi:MAG: glutamyl-tRNA reductase [Candidatus Symbiodolus clandestinus]
MSLLVLGVNAKTAPLTLREQLLFLPEQLPAVYRELLHKPMIQGALLLSTCNRSEIYLESKLTLNQALVEQGHQLLQWWCKRQGVSTTQLQPSFYCYHQKKAFSHLLRVAVGLDSLIVGESQILGQLKQAYQQAQQRQMLTTQLNWLFQQIFRQAKQIRSVSCLGTHAISLATRVCQVVRQQFYQKMPVLLLVGAGEMIASVAQQLHKQSLGHLLIAARCPDRARPLAERINAIPIDLQNLTEWLPRVDGVISATGSSLPLLNQSMVATALQQRPIASLPLLLVDLAIPRDMAADIAELPVVKFYTLDQLQRQQQQQQAACFQAEDLIESVAIELIQRLQCRQRDASLISQLRSQGQRQQQRLERQAMVALQRGESAEQVIRQLAYQLTNQLLHQPTQLVRFINQYVGYSLPQLQSQIEQLFTSTSNTIDRKSHP